MINIFEECEKKTYYFFDNLHKEGKKPILLSIREEQELNYLSDSIFELSFYNTDKTVQLALLYSSLLQTPLLHILTKSYKDKDFKVSLSYDTKPHLVILRHIQNKKTKESKWEEHKEIKFRLTPKQCEAIVLFIDNIHKEMKEWI